MHVIQHGLTAAGRYLSLRVRVPDRPGSLAALLARVGELGANVLNVEHSRVARNLALDEVYVELDLETRGPQHRRQVVTALRAAGYVTTEAR